MSPGLISLVSYFVGPNPTMNFTFAVIALLTSIVASFTITTVLIKTDKEHLQNDLFVVEKEESDLVEELFVAPSTGELIPLSEVSDPLFAQKTVGDGYAVEPAENQVVSPVSGVITSLFPTKHAIGIKTQAGLEVLVHMGIDTVELEGKPFELLIKENQSIAAGTPLANMNRKEIISAGKKPTIMVIITNMTKVEELMNVENKDIIEKDLVGYVTVK